MRLVRSDDVPRWNALMRAHHYLGFCKMCGRRLRDVAVWRERRLALLGRHAAALALSDSPLTEALRWV